MTMQTYDPKNVKCIMFGAPAVGFADGSFIKVSRNEDTFTLMVGADGETVRTRSRNKSGTIELTLLASSDFNDVLSKAMLLDEQTGAGVGPFLLQEIGGTTVLAAGNTWVKKAPDVEYGKEHPNRTWVLEADSIEFHVGGIDALSFL